MDDEMDCVVVTDSANSGGMHPLLIPLVVERIFDKLGWVELLAVRGVCGQWNTLGTSAFINRKSIEWSITAGEGTLTKFMYVMPLSKRVFVVRWCIRVDLLSVPFPAFLQFLTFIAPTVRKLEVSYTVRPQPGVNAPRPEDFELTARHISALNDLEPGALNMPCLEELIVRGAFEFQVSPFRDVVMQITQASMVGVRALQTFGIRFPFKATDTVIRQLPRDLKGLHFESLFLYRMMVPQLPYSAFIDSGFRLEELKDVRSSDIYGIVDFLSQQKDCLRRVDVDNLEEFHRNAYPTFPQLKLVDTLKFEVTCNSSFEFLNQIPNVLDLTIGIRRLDRDESRTRRTEMEANLGSLPRHPSVRKLTIVPATAVQGDWVLEELISCVVLSHCFPNLTHLCTPTGSSLGFMKEVFTRFVNLQWMYLYFCCGDPGPRVWESILSGHSVEDCESMNAVGNYDNPPANNAMGLANLKLKCLVMLEVGDGPRSFDFLFTELTYSLVFAKMDSLKQIYFVKQGNLPEACLPFVDRLMLRGIDLYRMNTPIETQF